MKKYVDIAIKDMARNKKRTTLTILSVMFGIAAIIFIGEVTAYNNRYKIYELINNGRDYDAVITNITKEEANILKDNMLIKNISFEGEPKRGKLNDENIQIDFYSKGSIEDRIKDSYVLEEGRFPREKSEIAVTNSFLKYGFNISDTISLNNKNYKITGIIKEKYKVPSEEDNLFGVGTISDISKDDVLSAYINVNGNKDIEEKVIEISKSLNISKSLDYYSEVGDGERGIRFNTYLINLKGERVKSSLYNSFEYLLSYVLIAIVILSVLIITYTSINASTKERYENFRTLKSMGADSSQIRKIVLKEILLIGVLSFIPGILLGEGLYYALIKLVTKILSKTNIEFKIDIGIVLVAIISTFCILIISSIRPIIYSGRLTPIYSGKKIKKTKIKKRNMLSKRKINFKYKLAFKNLKSDRSGFFTITLVMATALIIFNVFTSFYISEINYINKKINLNYREYNIKSFDLESEIDSNEDKEMVNYLNSQASVIYVLLAVIYLVVIFSIINIKDIHLDSRRKEFGIMFAVGMDKNMIKKSIVLENIIQYAIAVGVSTLVSTIILLVIKALNDNIKIKIIIITYIIGFIALLVVTLISTINNLNRYKKQDVIEMIKNIE